MAHIPPLPPDPLSLEESARITATRQRWRLMSSRFEEDVVGLMRRYLHGIRQEAWGPPDLTGNCYASVWEAVGVSYDSAPTVSYPAGGEGMEAILEEAGLWSLMQRFQRDTLGLREMLMHVSVSPDGYVSYRPVRPDLVELVAGRHRRDEPVKVLEWVRDDVRGWERHILDLQDPSFPSYHVEDSEGGDVTVDALGGYFSGESYPYRRADGRPVLPYVLYHAKRTGYLWDPYAYQEMVEGSWMVCLYLTFYGHVARNVAWKQRYMIGGEVEGAGIEGSNGETARRDVVTDPAVLLQIRAQPDFSGQPSVGSFDVPVDSEAILRTAMTYERRIMAISGLVPGDVTRTTDTVKSGYSLAVAQQSVKALQSKMEPQFRRGDRALMALTAILWNRAMGGSLPEDGYDLRYTGVGESPVDLAYRREALREDIAAGLLSPIDAYMELHTEMTRGEATREILRIARESAMVAALHPPADAPEGDSQV